MGKKVAHEQLIEMRARLVSVQTHLGLSEEDMGKLLGIEEVTYRRLSKGRQSITEEKFFYMITELEISLDYLFTGKGSELLVMNENNFTEVDFNVTLDRLEAYVKTLPHNERIEKLHRLDSLKEKILDTLRQ